jgi:hypothetical protein
LISAIAMNGAAVIHDFEVALISDVRDVDRRSVPTLR